MSALSGTISLRISILRHCMKNTVFLIPQVKADGPNEIVEKPFVWYQWYGESYVIKFDEFVNVVFLTNPNLSSIKISRTKLTRIQIMKSNSNFKEKTSHSSFFFIHFFTFCIIFNSEHTFYYSALLPFSIHLNSSYFILYHHWHRANGFIHN